MEEDEANIFIFNQAKTTCDWRPHFEFHINYGQANSKLVDIRKLTLKKVTPFVWFS